MIMNILKQCIYFICPCLKQLDDYEYIQRIDAFHTPSLNQLDLYEYIKGMDVFHTPMLGPSRSL